MYNKGVTTIELFDSKGKKVSEHREENLVTNAVNNIFNGAMINQFKCKANQTDKDGLFNSISNIPHNIASEYYGGLMVFSEEVEEDVNHCIPSNSEMDSFIGGGSILPCDITDAFHSTFVEEESILDDPDTFRVVYEFGNQQCNGAIKSICLTSAVGGRLGLKQISPVNVVDSTIEVGSTTMFNSTRQEEPTKAGNGLIDIVELQGMYCNNKYEDGGIVNYDTIIKDGYILQICSNNEGGAPIDDGRIYIMLIKYDEDAVNSSLQFNSNSNDLQEFNGSNKLKDVTMEYKQVLQDLKGEYTNYYAEDLVLIPSTDKGAIYELLRTKSTSVTVRKITLEVVDGEPVVSYSDIVYDTVGLNTSVTDYQDGKVFKADFPVALVEGKLIYLCGYSWGVNNSGNRLRLYSVTEAGVVKYSDLSMTTAQNNLLCQKSFGGSGLISTKGNFYIKKILGRYYLCVNGNLDKNTSSSSYYKPAEYSSYYFNVDIETMVVADEASMCKYDFTDSEGWEVMSYFSDTSVLRNWEGYTDNYEILPAIAAEPWVLGTTNRLGKLYNQVLFMNYLGTINNQSGNLVKDASQTMKITYTLTRVKEA